MIPRSRGPALAVIHLEKKKKNTKKKKGTRQKLQMLSLTGSTSGEGVVLDGGPDLCGRCLYLT